jgi:hypothetical protein
MEVFMKNDESVEARQINLEEFASAVSDIMQRASWLLSGRRAMADEEAHCRGVYEAYAAMLKEFIRDPSITLRSLYEESRKVRVVDGWAYGETFDEAKKLSPEMIPYDDLDPYVRSMDRVLETVLKSVATMAKKP